MTELKILGQAEFNLNATFARFPRNQKENKSDIKCPRAGSHNIIEENGFQVCNLCGLVVDQVFDFGPLKMSEENQKIIFPVCATSNRTYSRLLRIDSNKNTREALFQRSLRLLKQAKELLALPTIVSQEAARAFGKIEAREKVENRSLLIATCVYFATQLHQTPVSRREIAAAFQKIGAGANSKTIAKQYREFQTYFKLPATRTVASKIPRFITELPIRKSIKARLELNCLEIAKHIVTQGHSPNTLAAGVIYAVLKAKHIEITQKKMAKACGINEVSLRHAYKPIRAHFYEQLEAMEW